MNLRDRKREVVRRAILESAYALFGERGFDETTVEMVAARADVSARTVYRYFESKDSIVFSGIADAIDELPDAVRRYCAGGVSMPRLMAAFAEWLGVRAHDPLFSLLSALMRDNAALMHQADSWRRDVAGRIAAETAELEGAAQPRLVDHARAAAVVWVSAAAISTWVQGGCTQDLAALVRDAGAALTESTSV